MNCNVMCNTSISMINFSQNVPYAVGEEHNISYFTEIVYFRFYWLLNNDKWPPTPKIGITMFYGPA